MGRLAMIALVTAGSIFATALGINAFASVEKAQATQQALAQVAALVNQGREAARTSPKDGTMLILRSDALHGDVKAVIYDGRPNLDVPSSGTYAVYGKVTLPPIVSVSVPGIATDVPFVIVFNSDGTGEIANWNPGMGILATEPTCPTGSQTIIFTAGSVSTSGTFNCQTGLLQ